MIQERNDSKKIGKGDVLFIFVTVLVIGIFYYSAQSVESMQGRAIILAALVVSVMTLLLAQLNFGSKGMLFVFVGGALAGSLVYVSLGLY
tara:strand:- start:180 stop:449 length:270 start_codon:yes stop_codon:yes gene_type:complete